MFFFAEPVMAQQYPFALSALQDHAPLPTFCHFPIRLLVARRGSASPELVGAFVVYEQSSRPLHFAALRSAQPGSGCVFHQEPIVYADKLHLLRSESGTHRRQDSRHGAVFLVSLSAEARERTRDIAPNDRAAFFVLSVQACSGQS